MAVLVNITMTALNKDILPAVRKLNLSRQHSTIQIGRASKSPTKGLRGASDNAWFDSPVMSRDHAKISLDLSDNIVKLRDIGSMHGTFLNDQQVKKDQAVPIDNGDIVVFGAEVKRGTESFPPCAFRLNYEMGELKESRTYSVDLSSDIEEEEEVDVDSDDDGRRQAVSSSDDVSVESSSPTKASLAMEAIDLTREESPVIPSSVAEENDESQVPTSGPIPSNGQPASVQRTSPAFTPGSTRSFGYVIDSEESGEEDQSWMSGSSSGSSDVNIVRELDDSDRASMRDSIGDVDAQSDRGSGFEDRDSVLPMAASSSLFDIDTSPGGSFAFPGGVSNRVSSPVMGGADYQESDVGGSEARREDHDVLYDDVKGSMTTRKSPTAVTLGVDKHVTFTDRRPEIINRPEPIRGRWNPLAELAFHRPSSPSDAAMVKTTTKSGGLTMSHDEPQQKSDQWPALRITSRSLGEKTGKHDFFEAREGNKALLRSGIDTPSPSAWDYGEIIPEEHLDLQPSWLHDTTKQSDLRTYLTPRQTSPELDMTSAATFNASKASLRKSNVPARGLRIDDIIEESTASTSKNLKRKSDRISDAIEVEVRAWGTKPFEPSHGGLPLPAGLAPATMQNALFEMSAPTMPEPSETRPSKRLRTFVNTAWKAAACITVGGAGAVCLLAATAPSFA